MTDSLRYDDRRADAAPERRLAGGVRMKCCAECEHLQERLRTDFYPAQPDYWCGHPDRKDKRDADRWIGFMPTTSEWCPLEEQQ